MFSRKDQEDRDVDEYRQDEDNDEDCPEKAGNEDITDVTAINDINLSILSSVNVIARNVSILSFTSLKFDVFDGSVRDSDSESVISRDISNCRPGHWQLNAPNLLSLLHIEPRYMLPTL